MQRHSRAYLAPFSGALMDFLDGLAAGFAAGKQLLPLQGGAAEGARSERLARLRPGCHLVSTTGRSSSHRDVIRLRIAKKVSRAPAASTPEAAPNESEKPLAAATGERRRSNGARAFVPPRGKPVPRGPGRFPPAGRWSTCRWRGPRPPRPSCPSP